MDRQYNYNKIARLLLICIMVTGFIVCMVFRADNASAITGDKDHLTLLSYNGYPGFIELSYVNDYNAVTCECSDESIAEVSTTDGWTVLFALKKPEKLL